MSLICLNFSFFLRIILASVLLTIPNHYYIYYVMMDLWFSFPIADSVIILRNKDIKEKVNKIFKLILHNFNVVHN